MIRGDIGGLASGLYAVCDAFGGAFLSFLIGSRRGLRPALEGHRVFWGAVIIFTLLGFGASVVYVWTSRESNNALPAFVIGVVSGIGTGILVAIILLSYVAAVDASIRREEEATAREKEKEARDHTTFSVMNK